MPRFYFIPIEGEIPDDVEGHGVRTRFTDEAADDVEGHTPQLLPAGQLESRTATFRLLPPDADERDAPGFRLDLASDETDILESHVLMVDSGQNGKLVGHFVPADQVEGHSIRYR